LAKSARRRIHIRIDAAIAGIKTLSPCLGRRTTTKLFLLLLLLLLLLPPAATGQCSALLRPFSLFLFSDQIDVFFFLAARDTVSQNASNCILCVIYRRTILSTYTVNYDAACPYVCSIQICQCERRHISSRPIFSSPRQKLGKRCTFARWRRSKKEAGKSENIDISHERTIVSYPTFIRPRKWEKGRKGKERKRKLGYIFLGHVTQLRCTL
jgi:hypothetical protein